MGKKQQKQIIVPWISENPISEPLFFAHFLMDNDMTIVFQLLQMPSR